MEFIDGRMKRELEMTPFTVRQTAASFAVNLASAKGIVGG